MASFFFSGFILPPYLSIQKPFDGLDKLQTQNLIPRSKKGFNDSNSFFSLCIVLSCFFLNSLDI